nr:hypothetical protein [Sinorhizobium psoraleae]
MDKKADPGCGPFRRRELKACHRLAAITPPAVTLLLPASLASQAMAKSGGGGGTTGVARGEGGGKGSKSGNSGKAKLKPGRS